MTPENEIQIGVSSGCLMGRSPELALRTIFQKREIKEALIAVDEIEGIDGIELLYRRGLTFKKFNSLLKSIGKLEDKPQVLTVHAPLYYDRHSPSFAKAELKLVALLLVYLSGFFKNGKAPDLAQKLGVPLVVHAGIIKALEAKKEIPRGKQWLVETEKPPYPPKPEINYEQLEEVLELARNHNLDLVFDTSRIGLAGLPLREAWEAYTQDRVKKVEVIHLSGVFEKDGKLIGGQIIHRKYLSPAYLGEMKEFFQQILRNKWQGIIIIEHAPTETSGKTYPDKREQIKETLFTLGFLLADEPIKPGCSYSLPSSGAT